MDVTFEALSVEVFLEFKKISHREIKRRQAKNYSEIPELTVPLFYCSVKADTIGVPRLDSTELAKVLPNITTETLLGLLNQASVSLKKATNEF